MTNIPGRLINVSNRLPIQIRKNADEPRVSRSSGGLASALAAVWREHSGVWIGWPGPFEGPEVEQVLGRSSRGRSYTMRPVTLTEEEVAKFYAGFANEIVWPLFHDMPTQCNFDPGYWETYERVNRKFARAVEETAEPDDFLWVHDYHLMLVAGYLRESHVRNRNGFFLHIPFPAPDVFEKLPWREPILRSLLDFGLIGFQTERDRNNFVTCLERLVTDASIEKERPHWLVRTARHNSRVGVFPVSIDFEEFAGHASRPEIAERAAEIRKDLGGNTLLLGVDRMDYTKGIPERLKSFGIVLQRYPELRRHITLVQVVVPSREDIPHYKDLRHEVELLVSQINGEFTQPGWVPIHYMHRQLGRADLLAYYRAADMALITPLKDGMNLVAKEFCAAQVDERGVLIISEFAGAGPELRHGAILVNPNDLAGVAEAVHEACLMAPEERRTRMRLLRQIVKEHNVQRWARSFLQAAASSEIDESSEPPGAPPSILRRKGEDPPEALPGVAIVAAAALRSRVQHFPGRSGQLPIVWPAGWRE
jgi:trehalose 6-phosphate synthase/phosphatase